MVLRICSKLLQEIQDFVFPQQPITSCGVPTERAQIPESKSNCQRGTQIYAVRKQQPQQPRNSYIALKRKFQLSDTVSTTSALYHCYNLNEVTTYEVFLLHLPIHSLLPAQSKKVFSSPVFSYHCYPPSGSVENLPCWLAKQEIFKKEIYL